MIKGQVASEPSEGLWPGFSASGQDVWLKEAQFEGPGLVLSAVGARCGKVFEASGRWGVVANTSILIPQPDNDAHFLWYLVNNEDFWEKGGTAQPYVRVPDTLERRIHLPSPEEQRAIADYLDAETARIDALIEKKRQMVDALYERRGSVITLAVTHGLDRNVTVRNSGVAWLGEVPAHWQVSPLKRVGRATIGLTYAPEEIVSDLGLGTLVLRAGNVQGGRIVLDDNVYVSTPIPPPLRLTEGDILICSRNGSARLIGKNALITAELAGQTWGAFMTVLRSPINDYLRWVLSSSIFNQQLGLFATSTINQLTSGMLHDFQVPIPARDEQRRIADFLQDRTAEIDVLISKTEKSINLASEHRQALITAAVTGDREVPMVSA